MVRTSAWRLMGALVVAVLFGVATSPARAQIGSDRYAALVIEARSGTVLLAANADQPRYPASLTKMMTVYMALEAIRDGRIERSSLVPISYSAASMPPSKLGLSPGMAMTVEEAILALVTKSANDAAAALGEYLGGGSEERFAQMMTLRARSLGMSRTTFRNASGLPDLDQVSTARDMVLLGRRLMQDFPRQYAYFSTPYFQFRGRTHFNHNRLLQEYEGTDGIKTGYVNDSGFNLVASAERGGVRLVAAVFGGRTGRERDRHMIALLDQGFGQMGVAPAAPRAAALLSSARAATPPTRVAAPAARTTAGRRSATARTTVATSPVKPIPVIARSGQAKPASGARTPTTTRAATPTRATSTPASRTAGRVEQGDGGRSVATSRTRGSATKAKAEATASTRTRTSATR